MKKAKLFLYPLLIMGSVSLLTFSCKKDNTGAPAATLVTFNPNKTYGTMTDIDGNTYKTITIGTQTWMAENLKVTTYNDSTAIPNVTGAYTWKNLTTGAVCTYNNTTNADTINTYGRLYNWYAGNTGKLCPMGWHVPSDAEWTTLEDYLIANGYNYNGSKTGTKIAKAMASTTGWAFDPTAGDIGNKPSTNNSSGFTALPGGFRGINGTFYSIGYTGGWWSSDDYYSSNATAGCRDLGYNYSSLHEEYYGYLKAVGLSVRCVKD